MSAVVPHRWSRERVAVLTKGYEKGVPVIEIAAQLGVSKNTVIGKAFRLGLKHPTQPSRAKLSAEDCAAIRAESAAGVVDAALSRAFGVSLSTIRRTRDPLYAAYLKEHGRQYNSKVRGVAQ